MLPNPNIFCNAPWFELHVYWNGDLGFCCQEHHKLYSSSLSDQYNIRNMTIREWMNSIPMKKVRTSMYGDKELSICKRCKIEQMHGGTSRRHKSNAKSVIFTKKHFTESFKQSPHREIFDRSFANNGELESYPIDMHIDLGNHCNLSCKMCGPLASSQIAAQYQRWNLPLINQKNNDENNTGKTLLDWTKNETVWLKVCKEISSFDNLNNIHFMGGEPMLAKRFVDFCDYMISEGKLNFGISFVTNGTTINETLIKKLKSFSGRINIEVSIETCTIHNDYIRQGSKVNKVIENIQKLQKICASNGWDITIRPALSILSVGYYDTLLEFCLKNNIVIKSLSVDHPEYLDMKNLPQNVAEKYKLKYLNFLEKHSLVSIEHRHDYNESDKHQIKKIIRKDIDSIISNLDHCHGQTNPNHKELVYWCKKWDSVYGFDARKLYPELEEIFEKHEY